MSEIRCPMCGKSNPADAVICQFCQARLKPIWFDSSVGAGPTEVFSQGSTESADWVGSQTQKDDDKGIEPGEDSDIPDWLRGLRAEVPEQTDIGPIAEESEISETENSEDRQVPEWLKEIISPDETLTPEDQFPHSDFGPLEEEPDWLRRISGPETYTSPPDKEETTDWLGENEGGTPSEELETSDRPTELDAALTDHDAEPSLPDWLNDKMEIPGQDIPSEPDQAEKVEESPLEESSSESLDWLREQTNAGFESVELEPATDLPDWIARLAPESVKSQPEDEQLEEIPDVPTWLSAAVSAEKSKSEDSGIPDWLTVPPEERFVTPEATGSSTPQMEGSAKPQVEEPGLAPESLVSSPEDISENTGLPVEAESEDLFTGDLSWLDEIESGISEVGEIAEIPVEEIILKGTIEAEPAEMVPEQPSEIEETGGEPTPSPAFTAEEPAEEISAEELPGWLRAMRPVGAIDLGAAFEGEEQEQAEKAGPLSGLVGALPAEPDIVQATKPPLYNLKLRVSETQETHAALLAELIASEGEAIPIPQPPLLKTQSMLRMAVAIILFTAVVFSLLTDLPTLSPPALTTEVFVTSQIVGGLPPAAPALIAVDYSPGYSAELEFGLAAVMNHLVAQGQYLTFVSTHPTGQVQAEHVISRLAPQPDSSNPIEYTNLGFIPGGASGLLSFAQDPRRILAFDTRGRAAWEPQALQGVNSLSDFSILVIATENPDVARVWIEQIQPLLGATPLVLVVSAQSEPIVRPYYDAYPRQVQGMVSGLSAAVAYDALLGRHSIASEMWSPFTVALTVAVILIVMAILVNAVAGVIMRSRAKIRTEGKL